MRYEAFVVNLAAALLLGSAIGLERQFRRHPAGLRTNALVSVGAALFVSLSNLMVSASDPARIAAQVVSGIGFLCGGVILREGVNIKGMNTAATLWCSAAVGTLAGMGFRGFAGIGTGAVLVIHLGFRPVVRRIEARLRKTDDVETMYRIRVECAPDQEAVVRNILLRHINTQPTMVVQGISTHEAGPHRVAVVADAYSAIRSDREMQELMSRLNVEPSVTGVSWESGGAAA